MELYRQRGSSCLLGPKIISNQSIELNLEIAVFTVTPQAKDARQNHNDAAKITSTGGVRPRLVELAKLRNMSLAEVMKNSDVSVSANGCRVTASRHPLA